EMKPAPPELFTFDEFKITPVILPPEAHHPAMQDFVLNDQVKAADAKIAAAQKVLQRARQQQSELEHKSQSKLVQQNTIQKEELFLVDDFKKSNPNLWTMGPGQWTFQNGTLIQSKTGYGRAYLRSVQDHPQNFKAKFKFKTTGGDKWRSVGLAFDVNGKREKMIYLSAVQPGSKLQVSYNEGSKSIYPRDAVHTCKVNLNEPYELEIKIRDQLLNVSLNGEHAISYKLPLPREAGKIDILAFDAAAEFEMISISSLSSSEILIDGKQSSKLTLKLAKAKSKTAEASLETTRLFKESLLTAYAADKASHSKQPENKQTELNRAAALAARKYELAIAEQKLAQTEEKSEATTMTEAAKKKVKKEIAAAKKQVKTASQAVSKPGEKYTRVRASRKALEGPAEKEASRYKPFPKFSTGRRTAFARWITHQKNPLTARVAVNHIWLRHFGQPLVEEVTDFGLRSKQPIQHELLDWLAVEFMEHNWSMKHLHFIMVTSKAYQLSSSTIDADSQTQEKDKENHYYWRRNMVRMESELIRDSLLHLAGELDLTRGGPTVDPAKNPDSKRRSLYFTTSRDAHDKFLSMFDAADIFACYRRNQSVVPQQALALANSKVSLQMARQITKGIRAQHPQLSDQEFIQRAYEKILCVEPTPQESAICLQALSKTQKILNTKKNQQPIWRSRENLVHALLNHNDFITIR
ncbi:MAG: DUF1553 domain-containing protein, partial [Gimesia sp.]